MSEPESVASGPSEAAIEAGNAAYLAVNRTGYAAYEGFEIQWGEVAVRAAFAVDEPRIRADERQKVVQEILAWLRARDAEQRKSGLVEHSSPGLVADILAREFGSEGGPR